MYRKSRSRESTLYGNNYTITTHCEDNSSNTEVGNRVFANFNSSSQKLTTRSLLTHRNNDFMKFSWDPMQVVYIPRQQKAVCNREIEKLRGLERYFTRQNHIETYKQTNEIDKFRAKLYRLNNLRMLSEPDSKQSGVRFFPITKSIRRTPRIGNSTITASHNGNTSLVERNAYISTKGTENLDLDKRINLFNKGFYNYTSSGNTETNTTCSNIPFIEKESSFKTNSSNVNKLCDLKFQIKSSSTRDTDVKPTPILRRYPRSDKQAINSVRYTRVKSVDINTATNLSAVIANGDVRQLGVNNSTTDCSQPSYLNKKIVRFSEESEHNDSRRNSYDSRKFTQLVKLANNISGK